MGPGAFFACGPTSDIIECLFHPYGPGSHCRDSAHDHVGTGPTAEHRAPQSIGSYGHAVWMVFLTSKCGSHSRSDMRLLEALVPTGVA